MAIDPTQRGAPEEESTQDSSPVNLTNTNPQGDIQVNEEGQRLNTEKPVFAEEKEYDVAGLSSFIKMFEKPGNPATVADEAKSKDLATQPIGRVVDPARTEQRNLSLDYILNASGSEDIARILDDVAETFEIGSHPEMAIKTWDDSLSAAENVKLDIETLIDGKITTGFGSTEEMLKIRHVLHTTANELGETAKKLTFFDPSDGTIQIRDTISAADMVKFRQMVDAHHSLQLHFQGKVKETARTLNALKIPISMQGSMNDDLMNEMLRRGGGAGDAKALLKYVAMNANDPQALAYMSRKSWLKRAGNAVYEVWINGLLSGFGTHAKNIIGNSMTIAMAVPEHYMAWAIGQARRPFGVQDRRTIGEVNAKMVGLVQGWNDGWQAFITSMKTGEATVDGVNLKQEYYRKPHFTAEGWGIDETGFLGKGVDFLGHNVVRLPGRFLEAEDQLFKGVGYRMALNEEAYGVGLRSGFPEGSPEFNDVVAEVLRNPPPGIHMNAVNFARYQTFTQDLTGTLEKLPLAAQKSPIVKPFLPFVRTPLNILKYGTERTPLGILMPRFWRDGIAKGGRHADMAVARMVTGSMMAGSFLSVMNQNVAVGTGEVYMPKITGAGPANAEAAKVWRDAGIKPFSIYLDGKYYPYDVFEPFGTTLATIASFMEVANNVADVEDKHALFESAVVGLAQYTTDKSYIQGFTQLMKLVNDPSLGGETLTDFTASFIPSLVYGVRRDTDDLRRETKYAPSLSAHMGYDNPWVEGGVMDKFLESSDSFLGETLAKVKDRVPGWSDDLMPDTDMWGKDIHQADPIWYAHSMSPFVGYALKTDTLTRELVVNNVGLSEPEPVISIDTKEYGRQKINLMQLPDGDKMFYALRQSTGAFRREYVWDIVEGDTYAKSAEGPERQLQLKRGWDRGKKVALDKFINENRRMLTKVIERKMSAKTNVPVSVPAGMAPQSEFRGPNL